MAKLPGLSKNKKSIATICRQMFRKAVVSFEFESNIYSFIIILIRNLGNKYIIIFLYSFSIYSQNYEKEKYGDIFYKQKKYDIALLEYQKYYEDLKKQNKTNANINSKISISLMQQNKIKESLAYVNPPYAYSNYILKIYALFKLGFVSAAISDLGEIENSEYFNSGQKEKARLYLGAALLENRQYDKAIEFYKKLSSESENLEIKNSALDISNKIKEYKELPVKSPLLSGIFSSIIPGSGQIYSGHTVDGLTAFLYNIALLGGAFHMYSLESKAHSPHYISSIFGVGGFVFYGVNIAGAVSSANRYNLYHERQLFQGIREQFFTIEKIEKYSEIQFGIEY